MSVRLPLAGQTGAVTSGLWFLVLFFEGPRPLCTASLRRLVHSTVTTARRRGGKDRKDETENKKKQKKKKLLLF